MGEEPASIVPEETDPGSSFVGPRHCRGTATNSWEGGLLGSLDWIFGLLVPGTLIPGIQIPFYLVMKMRTVTQAFDFKHTCGSICLIFYLLVGVQVFSEVCDFKHP